MYVGMIETRSLKILLKSFHENFSDLFQKTTRYGSKKVWGKGTLFAIKFQASKIHVKLLYFFHMPCNANTNCLLNSKRHA